MARLSTVVLCGSLGASSSMWQPQVAALAGRDLVLVDHPGHGGAPVQPVAEVGDLVARVLAATDAPRFAFVGLSLGGSVGLRLALDAPERLDRLVLCCTSARFGAPQQWHERAAVVRGEGLEAIVDAVVARWFTPSFANVRGFRDMFLSTDAEGYARCCEALARWDVRGDLGRVATPTLCIAGACDPTSPPEEMRALARAIPGARCEVVGHARHLASAERPDEVNRLLREFL